MDKRYKGQKCGRCGEVVGAADDAHAAILIVAERANSRVAATGNYVANSEVGPTRVLFANGRTVRVVEGKLVVGWARKEADRVFAVHHQDCVQESPAFTKREQPVSLNPLPPRRSV